MVTMIRMIETNEPVVVEDIRQIRRTGDHQVVTRTMDKEYHITFDKRYLADDFMSFPYGYHV